MKGYVLMDALVGLCIFSLAFTACYTLVEKAGNEEKEAFAYMAGANLAQKQMEQLMASWNNGMREIPGEKAGGTEGIYQWELSSRWEIYPSLLKIMIRVWWDHDGIVKDYGLETFLYAESGS